MLRAREARSVSVLGRVSNGSHPRGTAFGQKARAPFRRIAQTIRLDLVDAPSPSAAVGAGWLSEVLSLSHGPPVAKMDPKWGCTAPIAGYAVNETPNDFPC